MTNLCTSFAQYNTDYLDLDCWMNTNFTSIRIKYSCMHKAPNAVTIIIEKVGLGNNLVDPKYLKNSDSAHSKLHKYVK